MINFILKYLHAFITVTVLCFTVSAAAHGSKKYDIPLPVRMILFQSQKLMEENRFEEAAEILEKFQKKSKKLKPGEHDTKGCRHYLVDFTLGNCFLMTQKYSEAESRFRAAVAARPDFNSGWLNLAKCCCDMKEYVKAGHAFLKGYEIDTEKNPETLYYAALCFMTAGKNQKALGLFQRLLKEHPADIKLEWKEGFAQAYLACDQPRKALPFIEELSEKTEGKKKKQWQGIRFKLYLSLNMKKEAFEYINRLIREYPVEPEWWKGLAHLHLRENQYRPALIALTIKGFLIPPTIREKRIIADLAMALDIPVQAVKFYKNIAENRFDPDLACRIAHGYMRLYQTEDALEWVEKGLRKEKDQPKLMLLKGDLLYELERYMEAASAFEIAARKKADSGRAWIMAGYAAWNAGDVKKSIRAFKHAVKYPEQKKSARKALRRLNRQMEYRKN